MSKSIKNILTQKTFSRDDLITLLSAKTEAERALIFDKAEAVRTVTVGKNIYLRGLIEYSNICEKNCLYCGIRAGNQNVERYCLEEEDVLECACHAFRYNYGSVVIQSGERTDRTNTDKIDRLIQKIKKVSDGKLGITLSCGEQSRETYQRWFNSGAHRYLLRIETSDRKLYHKIHPHNQKHAFLNRISALENLRKTGYQVGSGVMIGLPGQTAVQLADDLQFLKNLDVDMVGMGPYIEHKDTPLYKFKKQLSLQEERLHLSHLMIAVLRIMMPDINIAAGTALDSLSPTGRLMALKVGANVLMPNLTPGIFRENYFLYDNKPYLTEADELVSKIDQSTLLNGYQIKYGEWGDSKHFFDRTNNP
jgi:biotin synthase